MVSPPKKTKDACIPQATILGDLGTMQYMLERGVKLSIHFLSARLPGRYGTNNSFYQWTRPRRCPSFWDSIRKGGYRKEDGSCILAVLWEIWLHRNDKIFRGRVASTDRVAFVVKGLVAAWYSGLRGERGSIVIKC